MSRSPTPDVASRDKILDAAEVLFARRGYAGVGLSEIAEAVGLGKSSLFHHFRSKAQLYAAVVHRILVEIDADLARVLAAGGPANERLERWVDTLIEALGRNPAHSRLLLRSLFENDEFTGAEEDRQVNDVLQQILGGITTVLRDGMSRGDLRTASISHTVQSLIGLVVYHFASGDFGGRLFRQSLFEPPEVRRRKDEIRALLRHGLAAHAAAGQK